MQLLNLETKLVPEPLIAHSAFGLMLAIFLIAVAALLLIWTWIRVIIPVWRSPEKYLHIRHENAQQSIDQLHARLQRLAHDNQFLALDGAGQKQVLQKLLANFAQRYCQQVGGVTKQYQADTLRQTWPELQWVLDNLAQAENQPGILNRVAKWLVPILEERYKWHFLNHPRPKKQKIRRWHLLWALSVPVALVLSTIAAVHAWNWISSQQILAELKRGDLASASKNLERLDNRSMVPERWVDRYNLGTKFLEAGDYEKAQDYLDQAASEVSQDAVNFSVSPNAYLLFCQVYQNRHQAKYHLLKGENPDQATAQQVINQLGGRSVETASGQCVTRDLSFLQKMWGLNDQEAQNLDTFQKIKQLAEKNENLQEKILELGGEDFYY